VDHVSRLMIILLNGPDREQFDFKASFVEWSGMKDRRITCHNKPQAQLSS
jgi:hypothetical protein